MRKFTIVSIIFLIVALLYVGYIGSVAKKLDLPNLLQSFMGAKKGNVAVSNVRYVPLHVLEKIPNHGAVRCFTSCERISAVRLVSKIGRDCLVEICECTDGGSTNLAYDVFVSAGKTVKFAIAPGKYVVDYRLGDFWYGYDNGFKNERVFAFPNSYELTTAKGVSLKLTTE